MVQFADAVYQAQAQQNVNNIAPTATTYHSSQAVSLAPVVQQFTPPPSNAQKALTFFKDVGSSVGHLGAQAGAWLGKQTVNAVEAPIKFGASSGHLLLDNSKINDINKNSALTSARIDSLTSLYKSGSISKQDYQKGLNGYAQEMDNWVSQSNAATKSVTKDAGEFLNSSIGTATDVLMIMTGGVAGVPLRSIGVQNAARFLGSDAADATLFRGASQMASFASDESALKAIPTSMQLAMQKSVAEVVANTTVHLSSPQIARAAAVNLALKAPLSFNYISSTASDLYHQLDDAKYGDAVRNVAINASFVLAGGPVAEALHFLKGTSSVAGKAMFGEGSFIDEIAKNTGDKSADGIFNYLNSLPKDVQAQYVKNLSATAARNTAAAGGNPIQGAWRVINNMDAMYPGVDWRTLSHGQIVEDFMKEAEAARIAQDSARGLGLRNVVVGRWSRTERQSISATLTKDAGSTTARTAAEDVNPVHVTNYATKYNMSETDAKAAILKARNTPEATQTATTATGPSLTLPKGLSGAKPNYSYGANKFSLNFPDDITKSLYIIAGKNPSAREEDYLSFLRQHFPGKSDAELKSMGADVKASIKSEAATSSKDTINVQQVTSTATTPATTGIGQAGSTLAPASKAGEAAAYDAKYGPTPPDNLGVEPTPMPPGPLTGADVLQRWEGIKQQFPNAAFSNNDNLDRQIKALIQKHTDSEGNVNVSSFEKEFRNISAQDVIEGVSRDVKSKLAKLGYIPIVPKNLENPFIEGNGKLVTKFGDNNLFTKAVQPMPVAGQLGSVLTYMGLSPQAATGRVYQMFQNELVGKLSDAGVLEKHTAEFTHQQQSDAIFKQLSSYAADPTRGGIKGIRPAITDMRQLTTKDIMAATGKGSTDARRIRGALKDAWLSVPLQTRGLGDRVVDLNYKLNPAAAPYARIMGATRFSWNPFFQAKTLTKTESLVQLKTHGTAPTVLGLDKVLGVIFPDKYKQIENIRHTLHEENIFSNMRGPVVAGEAAEVGGTSSAQFTRKLLSGQERAISALISVQADKVGMDAKQFIKQYPQAVRDTVQSIAGYDKSSGLLSSPLARTLNFAFFPYRFEAKVTQVMAKSLASADPVMQMAVIRGLYNGSQFLKSPEGQAWYSQNSELIGLLKYFTPVTTIATLAEVFGQKPHSVGQFGELGGLPFGFIPMLLDAEGITHGLTQSPYVNPKTGQTMPDYIPVTAKAHAIAGIQDFLGSLFTYPGTQAGLPSKTAFFHTLVNGAAGGQKSDFNKVTPQLTNPEQKDFASVVQGLAGTSPAATPPTPPQATAEAVNVPATHTPLESIPKNAPKGSKSPKKKKSEYTPQLLPGQATLGQL